MRVAGHCRAAGRRLVDEVGDGVLPVLGGELLGQPAVQRLDQEFLAQRYVAGVVDVVGQGVLGRVAAPVVGHPVGVLSLHLAPTEPADDQTLEHVRVAGPQTFTGGSERDVFGRVVHAV